MSFLIYKVICYIFYIPVVILLPDDLRDEFTVSYSNEQSGSHVEALLTPRQTDSGVLQIILPNVTDPQPVCYPETFIQHVEAAKLIHVFCKQLGHVTFGSRYKELYPSERPGLLSTSAKCTGFEDLVSLCSWKNIKTHMCQEVLATKCTSCYKKIVALNGSIHNPGFPHVYLSPLTCEWTIEVPEDYYIDLAFDQFSLPRLVNSKCEANVQLSHGLQNSLSHRRLCFSDVPEIYHIPYRSVRIRFSSGIYKPQYERQESPYGFNIIFKAVKSNKVNTPSVKVLLIISIFACCFVLCIICYCCHRIKRILDKRVSAQPSVPTRNQLQAAEEFRRSELMASLSAPPKMDFSIYQSGSSSMDSKIARWETRTDLPVASNLALLGTETRKISITNTPLTVYADSHRQRSDSNNERIRQLRTKLVARFSSTSSHNTSDISVFFAASDRRSYSKLETEEDIPLQSVGSKCEKQTSEEASSAKDIPDIVIELVE